MTGFKKVEKKEEKKDDWVNVGWINPTMIYDEKKKEYTKEPNGKTLRVTDNDGNLVGYVLIDSIKKMLNREITGVPIKIRENP